MDVATRSDSKFRAVSRAMGVRNVSNSKRPVNVIGNGAIR